MRHALAPGFGDPAHFDVNQCDTQRNLDDTGREQAQFIGQYLKTEQLIFTDILSSQWCRCKNSIRARHWVTGIALPGSIPFFRIMLTGQKPLLSYPGNWIQFMKTNWY